MTNKGKAIVLTDGKAGHENQSKAFARALGLDFQLVPVKFKSPFHKMLSYFFDRLGIRTVSLLQGLDELLHSSTHQLLHYNRHWLWDFLCREVARAEDSWREVRRSPLSSWLPAIIV